jgi:hypothetical protein
LSFLIFIFLFFPCGNNQAWLDGYIHMAIKTIECKLGNMRSVARWVLYPQKEGELHRVMIQCDRRIALVDLTVGRAVLSDGQGGHQGFAKLDPSRGAKVIDVPNDILFRLRELVATNTVGDGIGSVKIIG